MIRRTMQVCSVVLVAAVLGGCSRAVPPTRQTTPTTPIACPPGKTLQSDGMCR